MTIMPISKNDASNKNIDGEHFDFLSRLPVFKNLDTVAAQTLSAELEKRKLASGDVLFVQGDPGNAFYIVTCGKLRVSVRGEDGADSFINNLMAGECVGEMSLLTGQPRTATISAVEDSELLCLTQAVFDRLLKTYPNLFSALASQVHARFQSDQTRIIIKRLFGGIDDALVRELLMQLDCCHLDSGQTLFYQGEQGNEMYVVIQGRLRLMVESNGQQRILGEVGAGESIGEFALLAESGTPESRRTATVYATRSTDMIVISRSVFENLLHQYPQVLLPLTRQIIQRSTSIGKPESSTATTMVIAVLPVRVGQAMGEFADQLTESLSTLGSTMFLNAKSFEQLYGKAGASETPLDHPINLVISAWLDERERGHKYVIYEAIPTLDESGQLTPWAQRCLEDADMILLVGEASTNPEISAIEKALPKAKSKSRLDLVLLHPSDCEMPHGTAEWLAPRRAGAFPLQAHHHVRVNNLSDFRRLGRRIAGKPIGLTLAGGAARGWAHVGVLRALEESNIEFDWVAGASMGAIMAAACALGWSSQQLTELASKFSDPIKLLDYTLPYASLTSTKHITNLLKELYADVNIEDTWHPFFCVSANLTLGKEIMHTSGPLWKAVRASMAFPGIFAPVLEDGCILVDGGAANNLPIDRMRELCPTGTVIGVDLITSSPVDEQYNFGSSLSGWQALLGKFFPFQKKVKAPHLFNIVAGLVDGTIRYRLNEVWRCADLLIKVPVQKYGMLEFDKYAEIIEVGYQAAQEPLNGFKIS